MLLHNMDRLTLYISSPVLFGNSLLVVLTKWVVIGRYRKEDVRMYSSRFMAWWLMDRIMDTWESFVGYFIADTLLCTLFYFLMGATVTPYAKVACMLREFDLIHISKGADVSGSSTLLARTLHVGWIRFNTIQIGSDCTLSSRSCVLPGANLAPRTHVAPFGEGICFASISSI